MLKQLQHNTAVTVKPKFLRDEETLSCYSRSDLLDESEMQIETECELSTAT